MIRCNLTKSKQLRQAGVRFDFIDIGHCAVTSIVTPIVQHLSGSLKLFREPD